MHFIEYISAEQIRISPFSSGRTQNTMRYIKQKWNIWLINDCQSSNHRIESTSPQCSSQKHLSWSAHGCDHVSKVISSSASILSVIFITTIHIQHQFHCMSMDSFLFHHQLRFLLVSILIEYYGVGVRAALSLLAYLLLMLRFVCLWCFFISLVVANFLSLSPPWYWIFFFSCLSWATLMRGVS